MKSTHKKSTYQLASTMRSSVEENLCVGVEAYHKSAVSMFSRETTNQADKEALAHIVYNLEGGEVGEVDAQMVEALRPSIEEAEPIETQEMALDYIGKRGGQVRHSFLRPCHR